MTPAVSMVCLYVFWCDSARPVHTLAATCLSNARHKRGTAVSVWPRKDRSWHGREIVARQNGSAHVHRKFVLSTVLALLCLSALEMAFYGFSRLMPMGLYYKAPTREEFLRYLASPIDWT